MVVDRSDTVPLLKVAGVSVVVTGAVVAEGATVAMGAVVALGVSVVPLLAYWARRWNIAAASQRLA
jgi:hypothetical protein